MNRIYNLLDDDPEIWPMAPSVASSLDSGPAPDSLAADTSSSNEKAHCLFTPQHYERNYAYPLIVWLHGPDDDERQLNRILPLVSMRNYAAVGPRGTTPARQGGFAWSQQPRHIAQAEDRVFSSIRIAQRWLNVAPQRIYLAGYDCGGTMALRIALNNPGRFAGVLSIGGGLPNTMRPFAQLPKLRGMKIFLATGRNSKKYSEQQVCHDLRLFHIAGMCVNLRQYPCGDEVNTAMLDDMNRWIMDQVNNVQAVASDHHSHR